MNIPISQTDHEWCVSQLNSVSRTFALTLNQVSEPLRTYLSIGYLACRVPDTIEDTADLDTETKSNALRAFKNAINPPNPDSVSEMFDALPSELPETDDWELVEETERVVQLLAELPTDVQEAILPWCREMVDGMVKYIVQNPDVPGIRIQTMDELEDYCYYVAGTVGHLISDTLLTIDKNTDVKEEKLHQWAEEYGLLLQLVNIAKDVHDDYQAENSVFIPIKKLESKGITPSEVTSSSARPVVSSVVREIVEHAEKYETGTQDYISALSQWDDKTQTGLATPYVLASATLRETRRNADIAPQKEDVKISRDEVFEILERLQDECSVPELADTVRSQPIHKSN